MAKLARTNGCGDKKAVQGRTLFDLGTTCATPGALNCLERCGTSAATLLCRHRRGDWGELSEEDRKQNDYAVVHGLRILSSYPMRHDERIWVITEADRSVTTLLLPSEY